MISNAYTENNPVWNNLIKVNIEKLETVLTELYRKLVKKFNWLNRTCYRNIFFAKIH